MDDADFSGYANLTNPELEAMFSGATTGPDFSGYANLSTPDLAQLAANTQIPTKGLMDLATLAKAGALAGGLYGASQSSAPTIINPGYSGGIPEMYASRKMITAPPKDRRPGSGGINYGGDVTYEATGKVLGGPGSTSAPGFEGVVNPLAPPVKYDTLKPTDPQERVIRAYDYFVNEVKGNTPEARRAAIDYLKGKGFTDSQIGQAYQEFMKRFGGKSTLSQEELINELKGSGLDLAAAYNVAQKGGYSVDPEDLFQAMSTMGATPTYENTLRLGTDPKVVATMYDKFVKEVGIGDTPEVRAYAADYLRKQGVPEADIKAAMQVYSTSYTPPKPAPNFSASPGATAGPTKPAPTPAPAPVYYEPEPIYYNTLTPDTAPSRVADAYEQFVKEVGIGDTPEVRAYAADYLRGQGFTDAQIKSSIGFAKGGLAPDGFVIPADVVSHLGNGSSEAGLEFLAQELGAKPIKGEGDGMSDSIPTTIGGKQPARVANDEAFVSPEMVKKLGNGDTERGAKKLYAMMDRVRKARTGTTEQGKQINPEKFMPGGKVKGYADGGSTTTPVGSSLSSWVGPYVADMLGKGKALSEMPYQAYTGPLTAGASPLQEQAFTGASGIAAAGYAPGKFVGGFSGAGTMQPPYPYMGGANMQPQGIQAGLGAPAMGANLPKQRTEEDWNTFQSLAMFAPGTDMEKEKAKFLAGPQGIRDVFQEPTQAFPTLGSATAAGVQQPQGIAQQYMNPYLQASLDPQLRELQRLSDIQRQSDAARMAGAGAFGGSRQAIMESEARRNLLGKQADVLAQGYKTAYDTGLAQFNREREAEEASRQFAAKYGLESVGQLADLGRIQRDIEAEGIAADKAQFEEARLNPYKMLQYQQSLLQGLPLASQSLYQPGTSNLDQFASGFTTLAKALQSLGLLKP